jgi:hypothetical protein
MATNFPGSLDSFTNPSSSSTLDSPSHAAQHANINDAMEAVQSKLGTGAGTIGEWTTFTTSANNATISAQACEYVRVNDWVLAAYYVEFSGVTGDLSVSPPVTGINDTPWNRVGVVGNGFVRIGTTQYVISPFFAGSGGDVNIYYTPNGAVASFVNASTPGAGVAQLRMNLTYRAA